MRTLWVDSLDSDCE